MIRILSAIALLMAIAFGSPAQTAELQTGLSLKYLVQLPASKATNAPLIILLHGYGSNEQDLFELRKSFPPQYIVISARAPYTTGPQGYQWFEPGKSDGSAPEVLNSRKLVLQFINEVVKKYGADKSQVYVCGFSQGAMMSYEAGLISPQTIKGIGVLSGRLFPALRREMTITPALKKLRIFISHGTADNRIPFADGKTSADYLSQLGLKPEFHEYTGMGHSISQEVLSDLVKWLK